MKIEAVFRPRVKQIERKTPDKNAIQLRILTGVLASGLVFGVLIYLLRRTMFVDALFDRTLEIINIKQESSFATRFLAILASDMLWVLLLVVLGTSIYGTWLLYPVMFLRAAGLAAQACLLIQNAKPDRIGLFYISIFPGNCLALLAMLMMGQNCLYTSTEIRKCVSEQGSENKRVLSMFFMRSAVVCGITLLSDLLNTLLPVMFIHS